MDHLAIMNPRWHLIPKILSGEKTIESRWYRNKIAPWNRISAGDSVYFKDAGRQVTAKAKVSCVIQRELISATEGLALAQKFKKQLCFTENAFIDTAWLTGKRYAILIFIKAPESITLFEINKAGYGNACAWITTENIAAIIKHE